MQNQLRGRLPLTERAESGNMLQAFVHSKPAHLAVAQRPQPFYPTQPREHWQPRGTHIRGADWTPTRDTQEVRVSGHSAPPGETSADFLEAETLPLLDDRFSLGRNQAPADGALPAVRLFFWDRFSEDHLLLSRPPLPSGKSSQSSEK